MIVNGITGYSASSRKNKDTLEGFLHDIISEFQVHNHLDTDTNIVNSSNRDCIENSIKFLTKRNNKQILMVGKSMGAVRTWWILHEYWNEISQLISNKAAKLAVILIDPHGWQVGDKKIGSYGVQLDKLGFRKDWVRDNVKITCIHQRNKYPKGCELDIPVGAYNCKNIRLGKDANHWNVTDINTDTGNFITKEIENNMLWLMGKKD